MRPRLLLVRAFVRRDWAIARSYRFAFAMQLIDALLYLVLFYYLGRVVNVASLSRKAHLPASNYFSFVVIGLMVFEIMHVGLASLAARIRQDQMTGTLEALFVTPARQGTVVLAGAAYDLLRATVLSVLFLVVGILFFGVRIRLEFPSSLILLLAFPAAMALFVAMGVAIAGATVVFRQTAGLTAVLTSGLAVLAGVYFPITVFPGIIHAVALASPLTWTLDVVRAELLGGALPVTQLVLLVVVGAVALPLSLQLFLACLQRAKKVGTLTQY